MIPILIILIIIIFIVSFLLILYNKPEISTMANFMNSTKLKDYLLEDKDNYYKNFSELDLKARKVNNIKEYYENIKKSCIDIDNNNMNILNYCIYIANNKLKKYKCIGFDGVKCADLEWNIGLVKDKLYEEGYPHTRHNVIIIPLNLLKNKSQLINTLIHEKIHVYQKIYPEDINKYLKDNGFSKYKLRSELNNAQSNLRSNPDMDQWIYKNDKDEIMMTEYNNNPNSIMDVKTVPINNTKYEHPFEYMAYNITNKINQ
jgi:hypothetical protein